MTNFENIVYVHFKNRYILPEVKWLKSANWPSHKCQTWNTFGNKIEVHSDCTNTLYNIRILCTMPPPHPILNCYTFSLICIILCLCSTGVWATTVVPRRRGGSKRRRKRVACPQKPLKTNLLRHEPITIWHFNLCRIMIYCPCLFFFFLNCLCFECQLVIVSVFTPSTHRQQYLSLTRQTFCS